jgi:hypothetical protein
LSSSASASSAVTKSPGTNSPFSSMKKQRSASPSQAMPRSAFSASTRSRCIAAVLFEQRVGLVVGKGPVDLEEHLDARTGVRSNTPRRQLAGDAVGGVHDDLERLAGETSTKPAGDRRRPGTGRATTMRHRPGAGGSSPMPSTRCLSSGMPSSPLSGSAPAPTSFMPLYCGGLCEAVTMAPPSRPRGDAEVEHLGGTMPKSTPRAGRGGAGGEGGGQLR